MSILKEHLIEISHPKEKNGIRILTLNLEILFDHGGQRLCRHFENNLTESLGVVKWKTWMGDKFGVKGSEFEERRISCFEL